jgi:hypothetical protein
MDTHTLEAARETLAKIPQRDALLLQAAMFAGHEPATSYLEIRPFTAAMQPAPGRCWIPVCDLHQTVAWCLDLAATVNVFIGCAPRVRRGGTAADVERTWCLWIDCDSASALRKLADFTLRPSIVTRSGTSSHVHAYWQLHQPVSGELAHRCNRRLALALDGDLNATDRARVMRPAGTANHKTDPPRLVECVHLATYVYHAKEIVDGLPDTHHYVRRSTPPTTHAGNCNVEGLIRTVAEARDGERNATLYWAACRAREDEHVDLAATVPVLRDAALAAGLSETEIAATLRSAQRAA